MKSMVQAIPIYVMSCFLLPANIIHSLNSMPKVIFVRPKIMGRIIKYPLSLMATCLQEKYYATRSFLSSSLGRRNLLSLGLRHRINNGLLTNISSDKWIPTLRKLSPSSFYLSRGSEIRVSELIDYNQCCWREDSIRTLFLHHKAEAILNIPLNP
ncbi:hypothetical protein M9H77_28230 [Catharanthus roseus]|uniref:Uncharacterized protein n=1 Tax=Catharanthus roseus TaxID=4058 RepID=A0ACC0AG63_CATRO|nr:hypothetical protein M9H77_28230 [Catharanthus roseus]